MEELKIKQKRNKFNKNSSFYEVVLLTGLIHKIHKCDVYVLNDSNVC